MAKQPKQERPSGQPVTRNDAGLCDALFDEIDGIRSGSGNPARAIAISKVANTILEVQRVKMEVQRHLKQYHAKSSGVQSLGAPLVLGTER